MIKSIRLDISIDDIGNGKGSVRTIDNRLNGYLLSVVLPKRLPQTQVDIYFAGFPDYRISISEKEGNVFRIKTDCHDMGGNRLQDMEDLPIFGDMIIEVMRAIPETSFPIYLIAEVENGNESADKGQSEEPAGKHPVKPDRLHD